MKMLIKSAIFALFLVAVSAAPFSDDGVPEDFECPEKGTNNDCKGTQKNNTCLHPNARNCSQFYSCNRNGDGTYTAYLMDCPKGFPLLFWDDNIKECNYTSTTCNKTTTPEPTTTTEGWPDQSTEAQTTTVSTSSSTSDWSSTTGWTSTTPDKPSSSSTSDWSSTTGWNSTTPGQPSSSSTSDWSSTTGWNSTTPGQPSSSSTSDWSSTTPTSGRVCPDKNDPDDCKFFPFCMYPNPENCTSFTQCQNGQNGTPIEIKMPCSDGLFWNDPAKQCDWKAVPECKSTASPSTSTTTTTAPTTTTTKTPEETTTAAAQETTTWTASTSTSTTTWKPESTSTTPSGCPTKPTEEPDKEPNQMCTINCGVPYTVRHDTKPAWYYRCDPSGNNTMHECSWGCLYNIKKSSCDWAGNVDSTWYPGKY